MERNALSIRDLEKETNAIVVDVRNKGYFLLDHIKDAINVESSKRIAYIAQENPDKKVVLYCHSGITAKAIVEELLSIGINNVYFVDSSFSAITKSNLDIIYYSQENRKKGSENDKDKTCENGESSDGSDKNKAIKNDILKE